VIEAVFRDRALYIPAAETLVCADLHLGRDAASTVQAPLGEHRDLRGRIGTLRERFDPSTVVIAGDMLHSFSNTPGAVAESFEGIVRTIERDSELVITTGNHDAMLAGLWQGGRPEFRLNGTGNDEMAKQDEGIVVCHGHESPRRKASTYVIGHDHPAIEIEGQRHPCYLYGPGVYDGADVLVLPAFTKLAGGVVVNRLHARDLQSPLITDLDPFHPIVRDERSDETLRFPPLGEFHSML
jgi:uncharacterized protein